MQSGNSHPLHQLLLFLHIALRDRFVSVTLHSISFMLSVSDSVFFSAVFQGLALSSQLLNE